MADYDKVVKGIEHHLNGRPTCQGCVYLDVWPCFDAILKDALAVLKEQEEQVQIAHEEGFHEGYMQAMSEASPWISVKDRLPTYAELKDEYVLVMLEDGLICSTGFDECIEGESIFGEWRQNFDPVTLGATDSDWWPLEGVTHWMPLPELPKEEDDGQE